MILKLIRHALRYMYCFLQLILKASSGIDYKEFYQFVHLIASNRLSQLARSEREPSQSENNPPTGATGGDQAQQHTQSRDKLSGSPDLTRRMAHGHIIFDLIQITALLQYMQETKEFTDLDSDSFEEHPHELYERIKAVL